MRVTVTAGNRRLDVRLPEAVPVAELVPGLARRLGVLGPDRPAWVVVTSDGRELGADRSLGEQGVDDGAVLALEPPAELSAPMASDDPADAVADAAAVRPRWSPAAGRAAATAGSAAALMLALSALLAGPPSAASGALAVGLSALLLCVRAAVSGSAPMWGVVVAAAGCLHAGVGGFLLAADRLGGSTFGLPWAVGGLAVALAGSLGAVAARDPVLAVVPGSVGLVVVVTGTLVQAAALDARAVHAVAMVLAVTAMSGFGWLALAAAGVSATVWQSGEADAPQPPVDSGEMAARVATAGRLLVAALTSVGVVLSLTAPFAVATGTSGALLAVAGSVLVLTRTRHLRAATDVGAGLLAGTAGLTATVGAAIAMHPGWRPWMVLTAAAAAAVLLVRAVRDTRPSLRWNRSCDLAESALAVALVPLLVVATGLLDAALGR